MALGTIWYEDLGRFHFFNDNDGWRYMDKLGHATTAYHVGVAGIESLKWAGVDDQKAIWLGGNIGTVFLTSVEILDGMSEDWGFSWGDMAFNVAGSGLAIGQELLWREQRIIPKWSYRSSPYAQYRPSLLGESAATRWLKDYNGQTYWASVNLNSFLRNTNLPKWLNVAVGYGANGMTGANRNPEVNDSGEQIPQFERYSQFYISPDIDFSRLKTNSKFLNTALKALNFIKFPFPALEFRDGKSVKFHVLGF